uniref:Atg6 BARA domain-containing protein n=1 Tax=Ciona savignyi TaxID=51511 RepID=H2YYT7_CIOSA
LQTARIKMEDDSICFMCARCKQLIKLDPSFDSIDPQTIQELTSSHTSRHIDDDATKTSKDDEPQQLEEQCDHETVANLTEELKKLKTEESDLLSQLSETEKEREEVKKEMGEIRKQQEALDKEEEKQLQEYAELRVQQIELEEEQCSADLQMAHTEHQLNKLKKTNVFNSTFHIWWFFIYNTLKISLTFPGALISPTHRCKDNQQTVARHQGHFGTINGFRLGRLPGANVEWTEINAAWGQVVLLLASLAKKMGLKLKRYKLVPYGNHSYIESVDDKGKELPLYGSGGLRFLWDTKFDQAMVAFLDCLQQFKEAVEGNSGFSLPYRMEKGKIEDTGGSGASYSIKMQFNSEEQWTKALKFMLTNLKWGLAWVSSQFTSS